MDADSGGAKWNLECNVEAIFNLRYETLFNWFCPVAETHKSPLSSKSLIELFYVTLSPVCFMFHWRDIQSGQKSGWVLKLMWIERHNNTIEPAATSLLYINPIQALGFYAPWPWGRIIFEVYVKAAADFAHVCIETIAENWMQVLTLVIYVLMMMMHALVQHHLHSGPCRVIRMRHLTRYDGLVMGLTDWRAIISWRFL